MAQPTPESFNSGVFENEAIPLNTEPERTTDSDGANLACPYCRSRKLWRNGNRYTHFDDKIQRWLCRNCGLRFSDPEDVKKSWSAFEKITGISRQPIKADSDIAISRQICVEETKNLAAEQQTTEVLRRNENSEFKQKILEYALWLKSNGRSESTILGRVKLMRILAKRGANLYDPESMKRRISEQPWCNGRKSNAVDAYSAFLKMTNGTWDPPTYEKIRKLPFIPKETEIDQLISACSPRMATFLQVLKETGARCGEIWQLKWSEVDFESKVVNITPEKGSNPRVNTLSNRLVSMLQCLPRNYGDRVFSYPNMPVEHHADNFNQQRKRIARKLHNPRIATIHFHTFRYWRGTMLYHQYRSEYYVMQQLGHRKIENTLLYIVLEEALFKGTVDYISKVAKTEAEICKAVEEGFEFVCDFQGSKIFRKAK